MKFTLIVALVVVVTSSFKTQADGRDLSTYPCNVFNPAVCFRLPAMTRLDYSVPSDFDLYRVLKGDVEIAVIYVGSAPKKVDDGKESRAIDLKGASATIYKGADDRSIDILISVDGADSTVHIMAQEDPSLRDELVSLLSGIRGCRYINGGGQKCVSGRGWGAELVKAIH